MGRRRSRAAVTQAYHGGLAGLEPGGAVANGEADWLLIPGHASFGCDYGVPVTNETG